MKYAFWPGCVSKGACPELYDSMILTSAKLGIDEALVADPIHQGDYVQFMENLIKHVPRKGDPNRYNY